MNIGHKSVSRIKESIKPNTIVNSSNQKIDKQNKFKEEKRKIKEKYDKEINEIKKKIELLSKKHRTNLYEINKLKRYIIYLENVQKKEINKIRPGIFDNHNTGQLDYNIRYNFIEEDN